MIEQKTLARFVISFLLSPFARRLGVVLLHSNSPIYYFSCFRIMNWIGGCIFSI
jgi:hypothetical protein